MSLVIILIAIAVALLFIAICFTLAEAATRRAGLANNAAKATFRDSYTKTLAQVFGGAAVVLAFAWTIIKDSKTLEQSAVRAANQQFIEAAKLMADEKIEARAAGNYSYEKLVAAYPEYYDPVINTLLAFILQQRPKSEDFERGARPALVTEDVQAAIYVIGKIPLRGGYGPFRWSITIFQAPTFRASNRSKALISLGLDYFMQNLYTLTWVVRSLMERDSKIGARMAGQIILGISV